MRFLWFFALLYYIYFIISGSFVLNNERYFVLFDDAMISMD
ncbi:MAG: hypothetical protein ABIL67_01240 [candidate division WOR-3 bacterium]